MLVTARKNGIRYQILSDTVLIEHESSPLRLLEVEQNKLICHRNHHLDPFGIFEDGFIDSDERS